MGVVLPFPNRRQHKWYKCDRISCRDRHCVYCDGGLAYCTVCKQGECELEDFCPGPPTTGNTQAPEGACTH